MALLESDAQPYSSPIYERNDEESSDVTSCTCNIVQNPDLYYDMTGNKVLIIFNHFKYRKTRHFNHTPKTRWGTFADVKNLNKTFKARGFIVITHHDWDYKDIVEYLEAVCNMDHTNTSCLAVAVMTHGRGSYVCAADRLYPVAKLQDIVQSAPSLAGKPKLFFIQACRSGHTEPYWKKHLDKEEELSFSVDADCFLLYAAYEDFVSFRNVLAGSWMMQALCKVVHTHHATLHLVNMVPLINQIVANNTAEVDLVDPFTGKQFTQLCKQIPVAEYDLNKFVMF